MINFSDLKVLVVGDICLDIITNGESTRLSPEAPVPVIKNPTQEFNLGMAGNVALNLKKLGACVDIFCIIGEDYLGKQLEQLLIDNDLTNSFSSWESEKETQTIVKNRIMANGHQVARVDTEDFQATPEEIHQAFIEFISDDAIDYDFILISDYNKGLITSESWKLLRPELERINKSGLFFVDTKKIDVLPFFEGMILFPNTKELDAIMKYNNCDNVEQLRIELDTEFIVETKSEKGAAIFRAEFWPLYSPAYNIHEVYDVCGAGDTFIAAFALYFSKYGSHFSAMEFANYCCSKVVKRKGTSPVLYSEVKDFDSSIRK